MGNEGTNSMLRLSDSRWMNYQKVMQDWQNGWKLDGLRRVNTWKRRERSGQELATDRNLSRHSCRGIQMS